MDNAFKYVETNPLVPISDYPYNAAVGTCVANYLTAFADGAISSYYDIPPMDVDSMKKALNLGAVSVAIQAD